MKYKFKAKDLKTGEWVEGDLVYAHQTHYREGHRIWPDTIKPMIVTINCHGGIVWCGSRHFIDESTIELIKEE